MASPPEKPSPEFLSEYIGDRLVNTAIAFIVLEIVLVALRFWVRRAHRSKFGWDDYLILPSLAFCISLCIVGILAVQHGGVGRHVQYVEQFPDKIRYWYQSCLIAVPCLYMMGTALPKFVILAVYLEVFVDKYSRIACWILASIIGLNVVANIPPLVYKCDPISYGWDKSSPGGWCADAEPRLTYPSLANIFTDLVMLLLPIPVMWRLHVNRATKIGVGCTFATGGIGLITSCFRFAKFFSTAAFTDGTWASVELVSWCIVEPGVYLFAACFIAYRPLVIYLWRELRLATKILPSNPSNNKESGGTERSIKMRKLGNSSQRLSDSDTGGLVGGHTQISTADAYAEHAETELESNVPGIRVDRDFTWSSQKQDRFSDAV